MKKQLQQQCYRLLFEFMRILTIHIIGAVIFSSVSFANDLKGQGILDKEVNIKVEGVELKKVLTQIEKQIEVKFAYSTNIIDYKQKVTINASNKSLKNLLNEILSPLHISYAVISDRISLFKNSDSGVTEQVNRNGGTVAFTITGKITDDVGLALPGVNIMEKGTMNGTSSDANGEYKVVTSNENATLIFSFIGFITQEILVANKLVVDVQLVQDVNTLGEVVVVGYGTSTRDKVTGSIATVNSEEIMKSPVADISNALVGRMAGLITKQTTGEPGGDGADIYIRGVGTSGVTQPLYVIDGIPREPRDFTQLSPNEIETVTILKDAASAAVFGARAGNGVVLVTTKRGKAGQTNFSYSYNYGIQQVTRLPDFLGSFDYATLYNEALRNEGKPDLYSADDLQKFKDGSDPDGHPDTDWLKTVLRNSTPMVQHNLSVNGGSDKIKYFISLGHLDQNGLYENSNFKRFNLRANIDAEITPTTRLSFDISGRNEKRVQSAYSTYEIFYQANRNAPTDVARYQNGFLGQGSAGRNPLAYKEAGYERRNADVLLTTMSLVQQLPFVKGLSVKGVVAVDKQYDKHKLWSTPPVIYQKNGDDYVSLGGGLAKLNQDVGNRQSLTMEAHMNYVRSFDKHTVTGLLLYTQNETNSDYLSAERLNFPVNSIDQIFAGDKAAVSINNDGGAGSGGRRGYVGRLTYGYDSRYLFEVNSRYDGSFNFPSASRWGLFPSLSAGWIMSEENFMQSISFLNFLKLRASWGKLGNDRNLTSDGKEKQFQYLQSYIFGEGYVLGATPGQVVSIRQDEVPSPKITWESVTKTDVGIEAKFFEGKVGLEADYFVENREDILRLRDLSVPETFGENLPDENIGRIENKGFEITLNYQSSVNNNFNYFIRGNFTQIKNKVIFIDEPEGVNPSVKQTGRPLGTVFGYRDLGIFQTQDEIDNAPVQFGALKPGDLRFFDADGNDTINYDDRIEIGRSNIPQIIYGISAGFNYKGIDFSMFWQGAAKVNQYLQETTQAFAAGGKVTREHLDRWTSENTSGTYPRLQLNAPNNGQFSTFWLENAAYLRLKNVEIGYTLPKNLVQRISLQNIRIYANGLNLLTISDIKIVDPELANYRGFGYPQQKVYNFGVNIQF